ncbi:hypothetical protein D3C81_1239670 [compost metagenome]
MPGVEIERSGCAVIFGIPDHFQAAVIMERCGDQSINRFIRLRRIRNLYSYDAALGKSVHALAINEDSELVYRLVLETIG